MKRMIYYLLALVCVSQVWALAELWIDGHTTPSTVDSLIALYLAWWLSRWMEG